MTLAANSQVGTFLSQIPGFQYVSLPFQGLLRLTSSTPIAVVGLRGRYNERGDFIITTTPPGFFRNREPHPLILTSRILRRRRLQYAVCPVQQRSWNLVRWKHSLRLSGRPAARFEIGVMPLCPALMCLLASKLRASFYVLDSITAIHEPKAGCHGRSCLFLPSAGLLVYLLLEVTCHASQLLRRVTIEESKVTRYCPRRGKVSVDHQAFAQ